jgi:glycine cleavage system transcriptional repressor
MTSTTTSVETSGRARRRRRRASTTAPASQPAKEGAMKRCAVLSALGDDRVGVANDIAAALNERGIEIEESHMTALCGRFASVMRICGENETVDTFRQNLDAIGTSLGFHFEYQPLEAEVPGGPSERPRPVKRYLVECYSPGPPGITALTGVFRRHDINIEDMETDGYQDPFSSGIAFRMKARIAIPLSYKTDRLREELREVERERNLDLVIKPTTAVADA